MTGVALSATDQVAAETSITDSSTVSVNNKALSILAVNLGNGESEVVVFLRHRITGVVGR